MPGFRDWPQGFNPESSQRGVPTDRDMTHRVGDWAGGWGNASTSLPHLPSLLFVRVFYPLIIGRPMGVPLMVSPTVQIRVRTVLWILVEFATKPFNPPASVLHRGSIPNPARTHLPSFVIGSTQNPNSSCIRSPSKQTWRVRFLAFLRFQHLLIPVRVPLRP